jgi:AcrR family transcriptional regulator
MTPAPLRKDAQRSRAAILCAARELFAQSADVPMYEIARRAGVGQATLYRHFPDRGAVAAAIFAEQMDRLEWVAAEHANDPDAFLVLMRAIVDAQVRCHGLDDMLREDAQSERDRIKQRLGQLLRAPLRDAKAAGTLRRDVTVEDVFLVIAMVEGVLSNETDPTRKVAAVSRALSLALEGLTAPAA